VNEFKILDNIGKGSFSKVKRVVRMQSNETKPNLESLSGSQDCSFAMKMMHKPILMQQRAVRYSNFGEMEIINNLDKVYNEVEVWAQLSH
jgi:serine/threonine protein kinase